MEGLGINKAIQKAYGFRVLPKPATMKRIGRPWHSHETIAYGYLWRSL
ncbi:MAG: hypothetical protein ACKO9T_03345 [Nitrospira sp.]